MTGRISSIDLLQLFDRLVESLDDDMDVAVDLSERTVEFFSFKGRSMKRWVLRLDDEVVD